jgi:hypothetical protein
MVLLGEEAQVKAPFGLLEIVLILKAPYSQKLTWMHPIELLDDVCHMESRFGLFGDSVSLGARLVHSLRIMHHRLRTIVEVPDDTPR